MPITNETRQEISTILRKALEKCSPPMVAKSSGTEGYELMGNKEVPYGHDKKMIPGMYFASFTQRKDSVAFYFFPGYYDPSFKEAAPTLHKYLKGKTCFHFKSPEQINTKELDLLLKKGVQAWKKAGYMK